MKPFFFFLCFLFLFGCEKATKYNSSPRDNFEALWRIMDENYCFFAFKDVDWDDVYDRYNLLVKDTMNQYHKMEASLTLTMISFVRSTVFLNILKIFFPHFLHADGR